MVQNILLSSLVILCVILIISLFKKPFENALKNPCYFKILQPKFIIDGSRKSAHFFIIVEQKHRYFINFPLSFKFYSDKEFKSNIRIYYTIPCDQRQKLLEKVIEFTDRVKENIVYITDVIMGKILIEIELDIEHGNPIIEFEILENNTCDLKKEHKLEIRFPEE